MTEFPLTDIDEVYIITTVSSLKKTFSLTDINEVYIITKVSLSKINPISFERHIRDFFFSIIYFKFDLFYRF